MHDTQVFRTTVDECERPVRKPDRGLAVDPNTPTLNTVVPPGLDTGDGSGTAASATPSDYDDRSDQLEAFTDWGWWMALYVASVGVLFTYYLFWDNEGSPDPGIGALRGMAGSIAVLVGMWLGTKKEWVPAHA